MTTFVSISQEEIKEITSTVLLLKVREKMETTSNSKWVSPQEIEDYRDYFGSVESFLFKFCKDMNVTAIVDTLDVATFSPYASTWSGLIAMLILAFPEVNWVFLTVEDSSTKQEEVKVWINRYFSTNTLSEIHGTPVFDGLGLRNWLRKKIINDYRERSKNPLTVYGDSNLDIQVRTKLAVVLDEELDYGYYQALMAYGRGFRVHAIESWKEAQMILGEDRPDRMEELALSIEDLYLNYPDQSDRNMSDLEQREKVLSALNLKTLKCRRFVTVGHGITDKESTTKNLKSYLQIRREFEKKENKISPKFEEQVVFKPVTGIYTHWSELGLKKTFVPQNEHDNRRGVKMNVIWGAVLSLLFLFFISSFFLSSSCLSIVLFYVVCLYFLISFGLSDSEGRWSPRTFWQDLGQKRLSWAGKIYSEEQGIKMDFVWPPPNRTPTPLDNNSASFQNEGGKPDHSTPGRILQVAQSLIKGIKVMDREDTLRTAVCKAVRATDALELLVGRTPTVSMEALSLKHYYEVFAECQFIGVEYKIAMNERLVDVNTNILFLAKWINTSRKKAFILNGEAGILSKTIGILEKNGRFEETEVCRTRLSTLRRRIERHSDIKRQRFGRLRFPFWVASFYIDLALKSLAHLTLITLVGGFLFVFVFKAIGHCWHNAIDYTLQAMFTVSLPKYNNICTHILSYFAALFGIVNIGLLVAYIYSRFMRK